MDRSSDPGSGFEAVPDEELMLQTGRGDTDAFEALVGRHQSGLVNYFFRLHWDRHRAEDQAQEVFIKLYTHARDYQPSAKFTTYMYRIAHNCWVDDLRRTKHQRMQVSLDVQDADGASLRELVFAFGDDPRDEARKEEVVEAVIKAVDALPDEHKAVFVLSEVQGLSYLAISRILQVPEGTVKSRMHSAVKRLRERLAAVAPRGR